MFDELMLHGDRLYRRQDRPNSLFLQIRLPWYRTLPVSCVEELNFRLDGEVVAPGNLRFIVDGISYTTNGARDLHTVNWFVLDTQEVELCLDHEPEAREYEVSLGMKLRIPYFKNSPDPTVNNYPQFASCTKKMRLEKEEV